MIHLDTNFLVDALVSTSKQSLLLTTWLESGQELGMSSVAWGEFLCGPVSEGSRYFEWVGRIEAEKGRRVGLASYDTGRTIYRGTWAWRGMEREAMQL